MRVRFTATAFAELNDIHDYIAKDNPTAAKAVVLRVEQLVARIGQFPSMARMIDQSGVRVFPVEPFPYLVFYSVEGDDVIIRNVRHGRRRRERRRITAPIRSLPRKDDGVDEVEPLAPLCFVLMPFGTKRDAAGRVTNFDSVYDKVIAPAVSQAGLEPIRADEEKIGGTIHKPMFERLMLCHYAVADITGANPNVFYELGIRHAMRPRSTVIVFVEGTVLPFDIALVRGISYRTDGAGEPIEPKRT